MVRLLLILFVGWAFGLKVFMTPPDMSNSQEKTKAIVVLTGGANRVNVGLECLRAGLADKLFISGTHEDVTVHDITEDAILEPRIHLGHHATTTQENALETREWLKNDPTPSIRLVTAHYHMRRSLLEFEAAMPKLIILPHVVIPGSFDERWWQRKKTLMVAVNEYNKFILAYLRLAFGPLFHFIG